MIEQGREGRLSVMYCKGERRIVTRDEVFNGNVEIKKREGTRKKKCSKKN